MNVDITLDHIALGWEYDPDPDLSWLGDESNYQGETPENIARYVAQDRERIDAYHRGDWASLGLTARLVSTPQLDIGPESLWGVESDAGAVEHVAIWADLADEIRHRLRELGASEEELARLPVVAPKEEIY